MPDNAPLLGTTFVAIETDSSKLQLGLDSAEARAKKSAKAIEDSFSNVDLSLLFKNFDKQAATFESSAALGKVTDRMLRPLVQLQQQIRDEMGKAGPAAQQYIQRFAAISDVVDRATARTREAKASFSALQNSLREGGFEFRDPVQAIQLAAQSRGLGLPVAALTAFTAAVGVSYEVFRKVGEAIGVDYEASSEFLDTWKQDGKAINRAIVDLTGDIMNLTGDIFDAGKAMATLSTDGIDTASKHIKDDAKGIKDYVDFLIAGSTAALGTTAARNLDIPTPSLFDSKSRTEAREIGEAYKSAMESGIAGQKVWNEEVAKTSRSFAELAENAKKVAPELARLSTLQSSMKRDAEDLQQARALKDYAAANAALDALEQKQKEQEHYSFTTPRVVAENQKQIDIERRKNSLLIENERISEVQGELDVARGRHQWDQVAALTKALGVEQMHKTILESSSAEMANHTRIQGQKNDLALVEVRLADQARVMSATQAQIEVARLQRNWALVAALTQKYGEMQVARAKAEGNPALAAQLQKRIPFDVNAAVATGQGQAISQQQAAPEIARINGEAEAYVELKLRIIEATLAKEKLENNPQAQANYEKSLAEMNVETVGWALSTAQTLAQLNGQIVEIYKSRGRDVRQLLKEQATNEELLEEEAIRKSLLTNDEKNSQIIAKQKLLALKLEEIDFQYGASWENSLQRQIRAQGTAVEQMDRIWGQGVDAMKQTMNDGFFDIFTGRVRDLDNVLKNFKDSIIRTFTQIITDQITKKLLELALQFGMSLFGGSLPVYSMTSNASFNANLVPGHANGGILGGGWMPVHAFAGGGVVSRPTLGLVGEGRYNEAVIPMPDNKSVPVKLYGGQDKGGLTRIEVGLQEGLVAQIVNISANAGYGMMRDDAKNRGPITQRVVYHARRA